MRDALLSDFLVSSDLRLLRNERWVLGSEEGSEDFGLSIIIWLDWKV